MDAPRGMTLIDVVVGTALIVIVFTGLFSILRVSIALSTHIKNQSIETAIAVSQMEYIRSLPYDSVGTYGGIPAGNITQVKTVTEDNEQFRVRTFIDYYDDPADGTGSNDTNGITTDYKRIKVNVSYYVGSTPWQITLVSDYAPPGVETVSGGGTLQINVVNAQGAPVQGATVTITNASTTPAVNLTTFSDVNGEVILPGAATSTGYAVTVTKFGYSTAQTYARDSNNQNPNPGVLTVVQNQTTVGTFAIDLLGTLTLNTYSPITTGTTSDSFTDQSKLISLNNTVASGGALSLAGAPGSYALSGNAESTTTAPSYLYSWGSLNASPSTPVGTTAIVQVVDGSGNLLPNTVLPGNSTGFSSFPVDLSGISTTTYPALGLLGSLTTTSASTTPSFSQWSLSYQYGPVPLPNVPFSLTGAKTIGTTGAGAPIYKTTVSGTTGASGSDPLSLEWDSYSLGISGYDFEDACTAPPFALSPGASLIESLILGPHTSNSLLVTVTDSSGNIVPGATVTLSRSGYSHTTTSSSCGAAYFGNLTSASDYSVMISKTGYTTNTLTGVSASGQTFYDASF